MVVNDLVKTFPASRVPGTIVGWLTIIIMVYFTVTFQINAEMPFFTRMVRLVFYLLQSTWLSLRQSIWAKNITIMSLSFKFREMSYSYLLHPLFFSEQFLIKSRTYSCLGKCPRYAVLVKNLGHCTDRT